jgi:hypothetical protein
MGQPVKLSDELVDDGGRGISRTAIGCVKRQSDAMRWASESKCLRLFYFATFPMFSHR